MSNHEIKIESFEDDILRNRRRMFMNSCVSFWIQIILYNIALLSIMVGMHYINDYTICNNVPIFLFGIGCIIFVTLPLSIENSKIMRIDVIWKKSYYPQIIHFLMLTIDIFFVLGVSHTTYVRFTNMFANITVSCMYGTIYISFILWCSNLF
jgi:hypothetical protein